MSIAGVWPALSLHQASQPQPRGRLGRTSLWGGAALCTAGWFAASLAFPHSVPVVTLQPGHPETALDSATCPLSNAKAPGARGEAHSEPAGRAGLGVREHRPQSQMAWVRIQLVPRGKFTSLCLDVLICKMGTALSAPAPCLCS